MTGSIDELRAALLAVAELIDTAGQSAVRAGSMIDDALGELTRLSEQHTESLVPAELRRAADGVHRGLELIRGSGLVVSDIEARL